VFPNGFVQSKGLKPVAVPKLAEILVDDSTLLYTVINRQLSGVDISKDFHFDNDATNVRIKARVAVGLPGAREGGQEADRHRRADQQRQGVTDRLLPADRCAVCGAEPTGSQWRPVGSHRRSRSSTSPAVEDHPAASVADVERDLYDQTTSLARLRIIFGDLAAVVRGGAYEAIIADEAGRDAVERAVTDPAWASLVRALGTAQLLGWDSRQLPPPRPARR
jgi:hypothetical protein